MATALKLTHPRSDDRRDAMYDWLSNTALATVLDGGSVAVVATSPAGVKYDAHIDVDGLCLDDGYVGNTRGWTVDLHY